jgi:hypothetical protein
MHVLNYPQRPLRNCYDLFQLIRMFAYCFSSGTAADLSAFGAFAFLGAGAFLAFGAAATLSFFTLGAAVFAFFGAATVFAFWGAAFFVGAFATAVALGFATAVAAFLTGAYIHKCKEHRSH